MNPTARTSALLVLLLLAPVALAQDATNATLGETEGAAAAPAEGSQEAEDEAAAPPQPPLDVPDEEAPTPWLTRALIALGVVLGVGIILIGRSRGWWTRVADAAHERWERAGHAAELADDDRSPEGAVRAEKRVRRGFDAGAPKPGIGDIRRGDDHHEILQSINESPLFLKDAVQAFCDQDDGAEQLRQFCEDHTFEAKTQEATEEIYLVPLTEDQLKLVPPDILRGAMSRRSQPRAGSVPVVVTAVPKDGTSVAVTEKKTKPGRGGSPPKAPIAPPVDTEPQAGDGQ